MVRPGFPQLVEALDPTLPVVVQAHDFPDHDAVSTAYGLSVLLQRSGFTVQLGYGGILQSDSLKDAIRELKIPISQVGELDLTDETQLIVVDGFVGNTNITGVPGRLVGVIDHHVMRSTVKIPFTDIREDYGSCATIIYDYYRCAGVPLSREVATSLLIGVMMDTAFMTRGVCEADLEAFGVLFRRGDWQSAARLLRNSLSLGDLAAFRQAIDACVIARDFAFIALPGEYTSEVMALVADFFLQLREITFVTVVSGDRDVYRLSVRSEHRSMPCDAVITDALSGIGSGGGHIHMGGGAIPRDLFPGNEGLRKRFIARLQQDEKEIQ